MNPVREFVKNQTPETIASIIRDWELFEEIGQIEDCVLREKTHELMHYHIHCVSNVVHWMKDLAMECYRHEYHRLDCEIDSLYHDRFY